MLSMRVGWIFFLFQLSCFALKPVPALDVVLVDPDYSITLENQTKALGFQDAFNSKYTSTNGTITVYTDACFQPNGTRNCTVACQNKAQMFSDLKTLHNCAVLPVISVNLANNNLSPNARRLAEELAIEPSNKGSSVPSSVSNAIQTCLLDTCTSNPDCAGTVNTTFKNHGLNNLTGVQYINNNYFPLCAPIPAHVNPDVGGIGVFISYVMQMGLAWLAFIMTVPWASMFRGLRNGFSSCFGALSPQRDSSKAKQDSQIPSTQNDERYSESLTKALVAFQKAQCWFMLATNIAGLIVENGGGLEPESLQQLYNTYILIKVIAIGGYLPITFTLLNLHMIKQLSWYPIILSTATVAVAAATVKIGNSEFTPVGEDFDHIASLTIQDGPASCGLQNLIPWCYNYRKDGNYFGFNTSSSGSGANGILAFCLATLAIIIIDHFCRSDDPKQQQLNRRILTKVGVAPAKPLFPHAGTVLRLGTAVFQFVFFWLYVYCFYVFGEDLSWFSSNDIYDPSWGFGQIVAILVWAPTLCDYLWDQLRGIPKGSEHILPRMYEVVKRVQRRGEAVSPPVSGSVSGKELPYYNLQDAGGGDGR